MRSQTSTSFWRPAVLAAMAVMVLLPSSVQAQFTGFSAVMDTIWHADGADDIDGLEFYGSYSIYAEFTSATDVLSSMYSDVDALGTPAAGIEGTCGCYQSAIASSPWLWDINPALIPAFPDLQYSTGWTIGMNNSGAPGAVTPLTQDFAAPCEGFDRNRAMIRYAGNQRGNGVGGRTCCGGGRRTRCWWHASPTR